MDVDNISVGSAINQALAAKDAANATKFGTAVLKKTLDSAEATAASLVSMLDGVGKNLNVVG
jgi:hypothetical protein